MQIIESILFLLVIILLLGLVKVNLIKKPILIILGVVSSIVMILQLIFGNIIWQFYPLYLAFVLAILILTLAIFFPNYKTLLKITKRVTLVIAFILILFSLGLNLVFPLYDIPTPSGQYLVGTQSFILEDESREENYGPEDSRRFKIQFWYPTDEVEGYELVPWLEDGKMVSRGLATDTGLPYFVLDHTALIMSNSYKNAPLSNDLAQYPVIVISHGWRGFRNLHTDLAEDLASKGYIVISIDHTYGSVATVFDDDTAFVNYEALPSRNETNNFIEYANQLVYTYAGDIAYTLDYLESLNLGITSSMFEGKLDLDKIGLVGHSTGGGANVAAALNDTRIKAIFGMDAWVEPIYFAEIEKGLNIPTLFLRSETWEIGENNVNLLALVNDNSESSLLYQIDGTTHIDYSMSYMYSPLTKPLGMTGELNGDQLVEIFTQMMTDFFDQTLINNDDLKPVTINTPWEEVIRID